MVVLLVNAPQECGRYLTQCFGCGGCSMNASMLPCSATACLLYGLLVCGGRFRGRKGAGSVDEAAAGGGAGLVSIECLFHCSQLQHSALVASTSLPALAGFTFSCSQLWQCMSIVGLQWVVCSHMLQMQMASLVGGALVAFEVFLLNTPCAPNTVLSTSHTPAAHSQAARPQRIHPFIPVALRGHQ